MLEVRNIVRLAGTDGDRRRLAALFARPDWRRWLPAGREPAEWAREFCGRIAAGTVVAYATTVGFGGDGAETVGGIFFAAAGDCDLWHVHQFTLPGARKRGLSDRQARAASDRAFRDVPAMAAQMGLVPERHPASIACGVLAGFVRVGTVPDWRGDECAIMWRARPAEPGERADG